MYTLVAIITFMLFNNYRHNFQNTLRIVSLELYILCVINSLLPPPTTLNHHCTFCFNYLDYCIYLTWMETTCLFLMSICHFTKCYLVHSLCSKYQNVFIFSGWIKLSIFDLVFYFGSQLKWTDIFLKYKWPIKIWKSIKISDYYKVQTKTTLQFCLTPQRIEIIEKANNGKRWWVCEEKGILLHCQWECKLV